MTLRLARSARRTHRWFLVLPLGAWLAVISACEENGPLFTEVRANMPIASGSRGGDTDAGLVPPDSDESGAGGSNAAGGRAGSAGAGTAAGAGGSSGSAGGDAEPQEPGGGDSGEGGSGSGTGGSDPGGEGEGDGDPGRGGVYEPPPNDYSCSDVCLRRGGRCFEGTCNFDCLAPGSCSEEQTICPAGEPCEVRCGDDACAQNVICSRYSDCNVLRSHSHPGGAKHRRLQRRRLVRVGRAVPWRNLRRRVCGGRL
jgi:hypothetical protein